MAERRDLLERLTRFSIDRRVSVLVLLASVIVVGAVALHGLPVELIPQGFDPPFLRIMVPWQDAPPREVLEKISEPLEEELSTVRGIDRIVSVSSVGSSRVFLTFKQGTDMDLAYREVRDRIERARREFPADVDRVLTFKEDVSGIPVSVIGVAVDPSVGDVYNLIHKLIVRRLERIDGVASVTVNGLEEKEVLIELDRDRTEAAGLNIYELANQLGDDSFTLASGKVYEGGRKLLLRSVARYTTIEELRARPVSKEIVLGDIATISYDEPEKNYRVRAMSRPAYAIVILKEGDANIRDVSTRIAEVFKEMQEDPRLSATGMIDIFNQGKVVDESLGVLLQSGMIGGIIAALVLFFFLRRVRVTIVVSLAIPLSLLIAITVMFFIGETLNLLSMLALMVCVGLLVDNSVVVSENIDRLNRAGFTRREAALTGVREIGLAIVMSTLTTIIVFLPVSLVEGQAQFFLLRMSIPISVALAASLVVALVVVPLGVVLTLPPDRAEGRESVRPWIRGLRWMWKWSFGLVQKGYCRALGVVLEHRIETIVALVLVAAATGWWWQARGLEIVDQQKDERAGFQIDVRMPRHYTLEETEKWFLEAEKIIETHATELGLDGWFLYHDKTSGELQGWFTTPRTGNLTPQEVTERVVELVPRRAGMELITGSESQVDSDNAADDATWRLTLNGDDPDQLEEVASGLEATLLNVEGVFGIRRDDAEQPNEMALVVDRDRTQRYGIDPRTVAGVVGYALRGQALPRFNQDGREIPVRVRYQKEDRDNLEALSSFLVPTASGAALPLSTVTSAQMLKSRQSIVRRDKRISRTITLDLASEDPDGTRDRLDEMRKAMALPEGVRFSDGTGRRGGDDLLAMRYALGVSILFIYLLMGLLFESFILPLSIVFTIPLAAFGVFWAHLAVGIDLDFLGLVGLVLLVGVVVNNGIVLVDTINRLREEGMERSQAILQATERRFRPIMMTAITTIGGMVPLAINGRLESGISYTSFAWTLIGGLSTATLLTLLVVPVLYTFFDDLGARLSGIAGRTRRRAGAS